MNKCEKTDVCVFFTNKMSRMPTAEERFKFKLEYCVKDKEKCARYMVNSAIRRGHHPEDENGMEILDAQMKEMFPDDRAKAEYLINRMCIN